jgi:hypothetical protein
VSITKLVAHPNIEHITPEEVENALVAVLTHLIRERESVERADLESDQPRFKLIAASELTLLSPDKDLAEKLVKHTLVAALEYILVRLGKMAWRFNVNGGEDVMLAIAERAAARMGIKRGYAIDVIDKRWDGIGDWVA